MHLQLLRLKRALLLLVVLSGFLFIVHVGYIEFGYVRPQEEFNTQETISGIKEFFYRYKELPETLKEASSAGLTSGLQLTGDFYYEHLGATSFRICRLSCEDISIQTPNEELRTFDEIPFLGITFEYPFWFGRPLTDIYAGRSWNEPGSPCTAAGFGWYASFEDTTFTLSGSSDGFNNCIPRDGQPSDYSRAEITEGAIVLRSADRIGPRYPIMESHSLENGFTAHIISKIEPWIESAPQEMVILTEPGDTNVRVFVFGVTKYKNSELGVRDELRATDRKTLLRIMQSFRVLPNSPLR